MTFKLNALVATLIMAASAPAFAAIQDATSGNGELVANFRFYSADGDDNNGGNDISAIFDLGVTLDAFRLNNGVVGFTQTFDLTAANYGNAWSTLQAPGFAGFDPSRIEFNVVALDNTGITTNGGSRYLTTFDQAAFPSISNTSINNFQNFNLLLAANQGRGTHGTQINGASTATSSDPANTYFGKINGNGNGDNWVGATTVDTTRTLDEAQNFWFLTTSSSQGVRTPFGVDLDGDGLIEQDNNGTAAAGGVSEFGQWSVNQALGTITYANPVPEADTWAMLVAGLGLVGFMARRRLNRVA